LCSAPIAVHGGRIIGTCSWKSDDWKCKVTRKHFHDDAEQSPEEKQKHCAGIYAAPDVGVNEIARSDANDAAVKILAL
jgi:hypothetical protein